jgi:hypothetical protein
LLLQKKLKRDDMLPGEVPTGTNDGEDVDDDARADEQNAVPTTEKGFMFKILRQANSDGAGALARTDEQGASALPPRPESSAAKSSGRVPLASSGTRGRPRSPSDAASTGSRTPVAGRNDGAASSSASSFAIPGHAAERTAKRQKAEHDQMQRQLLEK